MIKWTARLDSHPARRYSSAGVEARTTMRRLAAWTMGGVMSATFVYVSNAEDGDISTYALVEIVSFD